MTLDDEITANENLVQVVRQAAAEHLERITDALNVNSTAGTHYRDFVSAALSATESMLAHCRKIVSARAMPADEATPIVQGIMESVRESVRAMYIVMSIVEHLTGPVGQRNARQAAMTQATERGALRTCSFCGKTEAQTKLVAGPAGNICAMCTRLACGVLGIGLADDNTK